MCIRDSGATVADAEDLRRALATKQPGDRLRLTLERAGDSLTVTVVLGERPTS